MIALLADEDFNGRIIRGLFRRLPEMSLLTAAEVGLSRQDDPVVVSWAAANGRVLVTHDVNTMIDAALDRVRAGLAMPGAVVVPQYLAIGSAISDLALIVMFAEPAELEGRVWYLPL